ncbi:hypothetical protein TcYC6_0021580 [Trypanosoma cruzi]|nr:hypothetical protein TcYC6_0021580 [Trypanosoma cruzi]
MSSRRARLSPRSQPQQSSARSSRAGTPSRCPCSPPTSATKRGKKNHRVSSVGPQKFRSRALDVTPLFTVEGAVRYIDVINERTAWTVECDGSISVRSIPKGNEMKQISGRKGVFCTCLLFVGKTGKVWAAFSDGFLQVYDVNTFLLENTFVQHTGAVECIVEMEDRIYTGGRDWKIYQWIPEMYCYERQFAGHGNTVRCLCPYTGSTGAVLFTGSDDGTVKAWNPYPSVKQSKENNPCVHTFVGHTRGVLSLEIVAPNNQLWSGGEDTTIRVWDLQTLDCVAVLEEHNSPIACLSVVEHRVWSGDKHGRILLWDLRTLSPLQELSRQMRVEHRSVFAIRKMLQTVVWKVWTTGSAGHIHCWNAESMPLVFDSDTPGEMLPHTDEENMRALEVDNEALRKEVARLTRQLEKESAHAISEKFNVMQNQQLIMDTNDGLRRQLRETQRLGAVGNGGNTEHGIRSPYTELGYPQAPRLDLSMPFSDASRNGGEIGGNERGEAPFWEPITMSIYRNDVTPIITKIEQFFPGSAWSEILQDYENELRQTFIREAAQALGVPEEKLQHVSMEPNPQGLFATVKVPHSSDTSAEELKRPLKAHPFVPVLNLYGAALANKNERLKEALIQAHNENQSASRSMQDNPKTKTDGPSAIMDKNEKIAHLSNELDSVKRQNVRLQKELKKINEQLAAREAPNRINAQEEYDALKSFVDNSLKPLISRLKRTNEEKELDLRANEERIRQLLHDKEQLQKQLATREAPSRINAQEEYDALKSFVDNSLKPLISRLKRTNEEKELDLRANEERIRQLLHDKEQLQKQLATREAPSRINAQEEYDALKSFVDNSLKPLISRLERTNEEKELDLRANEERIRQLLHDKEQLQKQLAAREAPSRINAQEEYDALKSFVDNSLKPLISRLERTNEEKELDLRANEERIRQLLHDKEQLQKQLAAREAPSRINAQEEYDALKSFVDNSLKPLISRLKRTNEEKELDLRANEERIRQLLHDKEQLQKQLATREAPSRINAQEEYDALKSFVDNSLKPLISRLERTNGEKELDLRANEEHIRQLLSKCGRSWSLCALNTGAFFIHSEGMESDRHVLLDALVEAEESARVRESDLLALVDSLQNVVDRYVVEKEKLVARLESLNGELSEALKERDMAMSDGKLLEEECAALRDQLRGELLAQIPVGEQKLLAAYLDEVQRRRELEKEMYRGLSKRVKASW